MQAITTDKGKILKKLERIVRNSDSEQHRIKAMDLQLKILDNISGDINFSKPVFIVTGARRGNIRKEPPHVKKVKSVDDNGE